MHNPILLACALTLVLYLGSYMRLPLVPLFAKELGATTVEVGFINAGFMLAATALSLPLGLLSDRLGRRRLILSGMAISGLTSLGLLAARQPIHVGILYLFAGVGLACFSPSMMSYVGDAAPPQLLGRAYGWYTSALYLGMAIGPGAGGLIAAYGFRPAFLVSAAVIFGGLALGGPGMPSPAPEPSPGGTPNLLGDFRRIASNPAVLGCWAATFFSTFAWGSLFAFFPLFAGKIGVSVAHTGLIFTCQAAANALFRLPVGALSDRTGRREIYILAGNVLFGLLIATVGLAHGAASLYLIFTAIGASMAATFTSIGAVLSESVDTRMRGLAMGGYNTCIYGGFMAAAASLGTVIARFGFPAGFAVAGLLCAAATTAAAPLLLRRPR